VFGDFCEQEFKAFSRFSLQACFLNLFFQSCPKSFCWSLWFSKKKSA
jgi:hypothetical protein